MSPTALKQQVTQLRSELTSCLELCTTILSTRRLGSTHVSFDALYSALPLTIQTITTKSHTLRKLLGSRMDLGDETSRNIINRAIRDVQTDIEPRLQNIAHPPRRDRSSGEPQVPGFKEILRKVSGVEWEVCNALESLSERLQAEKSKPVQAPAPEPKTKKSRDGDEVLVNIKELAQLLDHLKASWVEYSSEGRKYYVNVFDKTTTWERPEGAFIQSSQPSSAPRKAVRTTTWEQDRSSRETREMRNPRVSHDGARFSGDRTWEDGKGW